MATNRIKRAVVLAALVAGTSVLYVGSTEARPQYLTQAQELGYPATDCKYCHTKASGGSGWNARGTFLRREKQRRHASEVDVTWLKGYRGRK
jgi:hypothetical protein